MLADTRQTLEQDLSQMWMDKFNEIYYGISSCESTHDKDEIKEIRLKLHLIYTDPSYNVEEEFKSVPLS